MMKYAQWFWNIICTAAEAFILILVVYIITLLAVNPTKAGVQLGKFRQGFDSAYYGHIERH